MFERYLWRTILPYFLLVWLLLTVILFLQQGSRFTEILFETNIPVRLLLELSGALIITVVAFTGPMALLAGIIIGLGQLRGDSELNALQAAGIGSRAIIVPCLLAGVLVSGFALVINLEGVPLAARIVRRVAVETAFIKLASPIEPGVFNTEFSNSVIYVRDGNYEQGIWERVFIYLPEKSGQSRLITAHSGRIDAAEDKSELVLSRAVVTTLPAGSEQKPVTLEKVDHLRFLLDTGRKQLRQKMASVERAPDEMGLFELGVYGAQKSGKERIETEILWHRRLALSIAPFFLSLLGAAVSFRFRRGGRGWSSVLSLAILIFYYLISLGGEQAARAEIMPPFAGGWLATTIVFLVACQTLWQSSRRIKKHFKFPSFKLFHKREQPRMQTKKSVKSNGRHDFDFTNFEISFFRLLERDFLQNLVWYFLLTCLTLLLLFHVFTIFEVLKGLANTPNGITLLFRYLLFLSPTVIWQIAPIALMIAVLITYAVKTRQNEIMVWGAAGQSIYTLIIPGILIALLIGAVNWEVQEKVLPSTNPRQDIIRARLRGGAGSIGNLEGRFWIAGSNGIYSFTPSRASDKVTARNVSFYQFSDDGEQLQKVVQADTAQWLNSELRLSGSIKKVIWEQNFVKTEIEPNGETNLPSGENPFTQVGIKTTNLSSADLETQIETADSAIEVRRFKVALQKKYATLLVPLVIVFFSTPLALWRRGKNSSVGFSLGITVLAWLLFTALGTVFETLGLQGVLPPAIAVWSPLIVFSSLGWYLIAKTKN